MKTYTALLIGGPLDGDVRAVEDPHRMIAVASIDRAELIAAYERPKATAPAESSVKRTYYRPERLKVFGKAFPVWVHSSVTEEALPGLLFTRLMTPAARRIASEYASVVGP